MKNTITKVDITVAIMHLIISAGTIIYGVCLFLSLRAVDLSELNFLAAFIIILLPLAYFFAVISMLAGAIRAALVIVLLFVGNDKFDRQSDICEFFIGLDKFLIPIALFILLLSCKISGAFTLTVGILLAVIVLMVIVFALMFAVKRLEYPNKEYKVKRKK